MFFKTTQAHHNESCAISNVAELTNSRELPHDWHKVSTYLGAYLGLLWLGHMRGPHVARVFTPAARTALKTAHTSLGIWEIGRCGAQGHITS